MSLQDFAATTRPELGPPRLAALREQLAAEGLAGFLVPRADAHQGEYVAPCDERLAWLTGFTGSAGFAIALAHAAAVFIDGRYRLQAKAQIDTDHFTPVDWPDTAPGDWLRAQLPQGGVIGYDPWLHTRAALDKLAAALDGSGIALRPTDNLIDRIWTDRPPPPRAPAWPHPVELAGESAADKRAHLAAELRRDGQRAALITLPDSLCWLLNIRGGDVARTPVMHGFGLLHDDGRVTLFADPAKLDAATRAHLGDEVALHPPEALMSALRAQGGPVRVDHDSAPAAAGDALAEAGVEIAWGRDPCILPKARKNATELDGARAAHLRDGVAMVRFLAWLDARAADPDAALTEIDVIRALERFRRETGRLHDIAFETIAGAGPHGAVVHYRVTEQTNRPLAPGELLLVDSGGQYPDGTTDITRTVPIGAPDAQARAAFTRVLRGMIAMSRARWPKGLAGCHLDALARAPLWLAGQDYDHGTGHGVGAFLSVHEGPQRLSRTSQTPLEKGMILSNEPGYYREGAFGIRIENLVTVIAAPPLTGGDDRDMLAFETLSHVPIDRRLIDAEALSGEERAWLNDYHAATREKLAPLLDADARDWLGAATSPL